MKRILAILLLLCSAAGAQTVAVTANLKTIFGGNQATRAKVCFTLVDASTGQMVIDPHVVGTGVLVNTSDVCIAPDANGLVSTNLVANDQITIQGITDTSYYSISFLYNSSPVHGALYHFALASGAADLNSKSPATLTPSTTPTPSDATYMRVDAGNSPTTGAWTFVGTTTSPVFNATTGFRVNGAATSGRFLKGDGTNFVISSGAASGTGACTNQFVAALNSDASPTCTTVTLASAQFANQGTTTTVLHGNAAGNPAFSLVALTTDVSGILPLANGGTGNATGPQVGPKSQIFTGSGTFTIPANVTSVKVIIVGGGGAGGGGTAGNSGGGGGSGGIAIKWLTGLTPGNTIAVTVGGGGTGNSGAGGGNGTASTIASGTQSITTVTAQAGQGGATTGIVSAGGAGGTISTNGDVNGAGVAGSPSLIATISGQGASTYLGGGGTVQGTGPGAAAVANTGSGGSGCGSGGTNTGGNGAAGIVIFEWTT